MSSAFVLNAHAGHAAVAIRCLGKQGLRVTAGSPRRWNAGRFSRHADRYVSYPPFEANPEGFLSAIESELEAGDYDMLLPINSKTVETVVKHRSRFEQYTTVPFPPYEKLRVGLNQRRTIEAADEFDIAHPETVVDGEGAIGTVEERIGYPVVVKAERGEGRNGVVVCESREELERARRDITERFGPVLFQEFIPNGGERGVYTFYGRPGELTALTVQRRLRTNPPEGGASTYRETIADPDLLARADELLAGLDWHGVAMAEFRIDARTGEPQLIEINPRLWGSLALAACAGVNFPYLLYRLAVGDDLEPRLEYAVGVQARCLLADAMQVRAREDTLQALREFLSPASKPCCYDLLSRDDPLPVLGRILYKVSLSFD